MNICLRSLVFALTLACAGKVSAQGLVHFGNTGSPMVVVTNGILSGPNAGLIFGPIGSYYFALFVAPSSQVSVDSSFSGWTFTGNYGTNVAAGKFHGDYTADPAVIIPGYTAGSTANFCVVGWSSNIGKSWDQVFTWINNPSGQGLFGVSGIAQDVILGGGTLPVEALFGRLPTETGSFSLRMNPATIPEPSALWFAAPVVVSLLLSARARRSKPITPV